MLAGGPICESCQTPVLEGDSKCPKCGAPLEFYSISPVTRDNLYEALATPVCLRTREDESIGYLYDYVTDEEEMNCHTMIVENRYVDIDYMDDFSHYYARCFKRYDRVCRRLHFFTKLDLAPFERYMAGEGDDPETLATTLQPSYRGFIVARPLPYTVIGRTVLAPWKMTVTGSAGKFPLGKDYLGEDEQGKRSIRCVHVYPVNLAGIDLTVKGLAFQEQDSVIAACATSALWSAFHQTAYIFHHALPSTYEITSHATRYLVRFRPIPSGGLTVSQMCEAVRALGLEAELRDVQELNPSTREWDYPYPFLSAAYGYLRGGLPVVLSAELLGIGGHAVTLVGYRLDDNGPGFDEMKFWSPNQTIKLRGARIVRLYAHDDQIGPYSRLQVETNKKDGQAALPLVLGSTWERRTGAPTKFIPYSILVPLYHKIRVPWLSAYLLAEQMNVLTRKPDGGGSTVEWDIFLSTVNAYKKEMARRATLSKEVRRNILRAKYPRFFWRARAFDGAQEVCEMLIDATDMEQSFQLFALKVYDDELRDNLKEIHPETLFTLGQTWRGRSLAAFIQHLFGSAADAKAM